MGGDQIGKESGVAALAKNVGRKNAAAKEVAVTGFGGTDRFQKAIRRGSPGPTQNGVHCFAPFVRGYRLTHHGVTTKLSHNLWR